MSFLLLMKEETDGRVQSVVLKTSFSKAQMQPQVVLAGLILLVGTKSVQRD